MDRIEQRLLVPARGDAGSVAGGGPAGTSLTGSEREQLLDLAAQLAEPDLSRETRLNLAERMRQTLNHNVTMEK